MSRLLWGFALTLMLAGQVRAQGVIQDAYSPLVGWRQSSGIEVSPIHVGLMPDGKLFFITEYNFFFHPEVDLAAPGFVPEYLFEMQPTALGSALPQSVQVTPLLAPAPFGQRLDKAANVAHYQSPVCAGHAPMADGRIFIASGAKATVDLALYAKGDLWGSLTVDGIAESLTFDPATRTFTLNPRTIIAGPQSGRPLRWYATVTRLADSRMLVTGGYEKVLPVLGYNGSVEVFNPATNAWRAVSDLQSTPAGIENPDYTHVFQLPYSDSDDNTVLVVGGSGEALFLRLGEPSGTWERTGKFRPGAKAYIDANPTRKVFPNFGSSSALLPLRLPESQWGYANGSILYAGGEHDTPGESHVDVYDPVANAWGPSIAMHGRRHHPSTVLLPDGRVLVLAGHDDESPVSLTGYAEYVDPQNGFAVTQGNAFMPEVRGYHTVTVLLPDGSVLLGGGNVDGNDGVERADFRYYYPDYISKPRPRILSSEPAMQIGGYASFTVPHGTGVGEAVLMGLGSMTHSFDENQRNVQLRLISTGRSIRFTSGVPQVVGTDQCTSGANPCQDLYLVQAPTSMKVAPPGPYMLFVLDTNRVPSTGKMIMLKGGERQDGGEIGAGDRGSRAQGGLR